MKKFEEIATFAFACIGFGVLFMFGMLFIGEVVCWTLH